MKVIDNGTSVRNPMSSDLNLTIAVPVSIEAARAKRASNEAIIDASIRAVDAMALCMHDSTFGG